MMEDYASVNPSSNPIANSLHNLSSDQLVFLVGQYSWFSKTIGSLLLDAFYVTMSAGWLDIGNELKQNISEELDICNDKLPHYVLLRLGIKEGLEIDISSVKQSPATETFLLGLRDCVNNPDPAYVSGASYALESSAVPELVMVYSWVQKLFGDIAKAIPDHIRLFFESHIQEIEILHKGRLGIVCSRYISQAHQDQFSMGFKSILQIMDQWWNSLESEVCLLE
jgi:hypothetical protein